MGHLSESPLMLSVSGCRGVLGESLTPEVASRFAGAFATVLRERAGDTVVVLGRDGRRGSQMVASAAVAGLTAAGCDVIDLGVAMTPTTAVMTDAMARAGAKRRAAGMVITASHNPQQWCGLKCLLAEGGVAGSSAAAPPADVAQAIIERFKTPASRGAGWASIGSVSQDSSANEEHVSRVMEAVEAAGLAASTFELGEDLTIAVDSVNASGIEGTRLALEGLGCEEILHLGSEPTGVFQHAPEPTLENLTLSGGLCDAVRESGAAVGFAQDPDADRLALIDEAGRYVGEEYTLVLCALALLQARAARGVTGEPLLVTNLSTSRMLDDVAAQFGGRVVRTPVGEAHVVAEMKRLAAEGRDVVCGGEGNGGIIWPQVCYVRDSIAGMALITWLLSKAAPGGTAKTLSQLTASIPSYAIRKRKVGLASPAAALPALQRLGEMFADAKPDRRDGVWVNLPAQRAWLHVRASNTEPILRLIAEAPTTQAADDLLDRAATAL